MSTVASPLRNDRPRGRWAGRLFYGYLILSLAIGFVTLGALLIQVFAKGYKWFDARGARLARPRRHRGSGCGDEGRRHRDR